VVCREVLKEVIIILSLVSKPSLSVVLCVVDSVEKMSNSGIYKLKTRAHRGSHGSVYVDYCRPTCDAMQFVGPG